jgi:NAD(P)-dependent dehydrogenase (short-subunit alcohol dehydrogenase family)
LIDLTNKIAVVSGGAGEIGAAICSLLAELGAEIYVLDVNSEVGVSTVAAVDSLGGRAHFIHTDLTSYEDVRNAVATPLQERGRIDIAVGGVGWTAAHRFLDETPEYWRHIVDLNLMSAVHLTHAVLPGMVDRQDGRIVLVSSLAGRIGRSERTLYSAAKAGVIGFARAVALEHAALGVTINCVAPGATDTE